MEHSSRENPPGQAVLKNKFGAFEAVFSPLYELIDNPQTTDEVRKKAMLALPIIAANVERTRANIVKELGEKGEVAQSILDLAVMSNKRDLRALLPEETDITVEGRFTYALLAYCEEQSKQFDGRGNR